MCKHNIVSTVKYIGIGAIYGCNHQCHMSRIKIDMMSYVRDLVRLAGLNDDK